MQDQRPTVRSRALGRVLARAAQEKDLTNYRLARELGWSDAKISRVFNGKRPACSEDIAAIMALCGIHSPHRDELLSIARRVREPGWWVDFDGCLPTHLFTLVDYEDWAAAITEFQTAVIPGLLQTERYVRALLLARPSIPTDQVEDRVRFRLQRQSILDGPKSFHFFIDEFVLHRFGPGPFILSEQLNQLVRLSVRPNIEIRIVPANTGFTSIRASYAHLRFEDFDPIVYLESETTVQFLENPKTLAAYKFSLDELDSVALSEEQSRDVLANLASSLGALREEHRDFPASWRMAEEFPE